MGRSRNPQAQNDQNDQGRAASSGESVGRRALLRRAATVAAAGIGGVAATEMLSAGPASAAAGDALLLQAGNDAGTNRTTLTSAATTGSTMEISHSAKIANLRLPPVDTAVDYAGDKTHTRQGDLGGKMAGGELLNLTESVKDPKTGLVSDVDTLFWMAGDNASKDLTNMAVVLTTATGTVFAPFGPKRVLDTRKSSGRTLLTPKSGALDSSGRLRAGKFVELKLASFVIFGYAVHFNLTATGEAAGGYLTVWGAGAQPSASNLNFQKVSIANHGVASLSANMSIFIYASQTTHVILDVQGWTLPDFSFLIANNSAAVPFQGAQAQSRFVPQAIPRRTTER